MRLIRGVRIVRVEMEAPAEGLVSLPILQVEDIQLLTLRMQVRRAVQLNQSTIGGNTIKIIWVIRNRLW